MEPRKPIPGRRRCFRARKATRFGRTIARSERPGVVEEPGMCRSSLDGNREVPRLAGRGAPLWPASGRRGVVADDERRWEVRLRNSVCLTVDASGGFKSRSARGPGPISEGGGNASPAREDGRYGEATEAQRRKPGTR